MINEAASQETKAKKILVAVDGSTPSIKGIERAVQMAKEMNADLIALYVDTVLEDMDGRGYGTYTLLKDVKDQLHAEGVESAVGDILEKHHKEAVKSVALIHGEAGLDVAVKLAKEQGVKVKTMIERGRAATTVVRIAEQENVDMIIIGSHGMTGLSKIIIGSVADKICKLASRSCLIVKP